MGESAVTLRYAEALYGLAKDQGRVAEILADLGALKQSFGADAASFRRLLDPRAEISEKDALLQERFLGGREPLVAKLMRLLVQRRRESILGDFFRTYLEVHEAGEGILRVEVETAQSLDAGATEELRSRLQQATGQDVVLDARVVPALLGGMRFRVGSRLLDGSVQRRLEKISQELRSAPLAAN